MTVKEALELAVATLADAKVIGASTDAELILAHVLHQDRVWLLAHEDDSLTQAQERLTTSLVQKRALRQPLSYVLGHREFAGLDFKIDSRALTPRVETETIVEQVAKRAPHNATVLDVGTGSGAMAISLKYLRPDLTITASEVSAGALALAKENAAKLLTKDQSIMFVQSDLLHAIHEPYDVIVANLPYVTRRMELLPEVQAEPDIALFGGADDGLNLYRKFFKQLPRHLKGGSEIWIESDPWQQPELIKLAGTTGLQVQFQDYFILGFMQATATAE